MSKGGRQRPAAAAADATAPAKHGGSSTRVWPAVLVLIIAVAAGAGWYAKQPAAAQSWAGGRSASPLSSSSSSAPTQSKPVMPTRTDYIELPSNVSVATLRVVADPNIFLIWTTPESTFRARHAAVLDSYLAHHPRAHITIYASHLPLDFFGRYRAAGYDVSVVRLDDAFLLALGADCPGRAWLANLSTWRQGRYFYSHITDYLRFCLLYRQGGVYSDFDAVLLQPLDMAAWGATFIGKDRVHAHRTSHTACPWCLPGGNLYLAPGLMASARGGELARAALVQGFERAYDPDVFNAVGPRAVTVAFRELADSAGVTVLEPHVFYPYSFWAVAPLFARSEDEYFVEGSLKQAAIQATRLAQSSHSLHLYGHVSNRLAVERDSVVSAALNAARVFADDMLTKTLEEHDFAHWGHAPDVPVLLAPSYASIDGPVQRVAGLRFLAFERIRSERFSLRIAVSAGAVALAGHEEERGWRASLQLDGLLPAQVNDMLARLHVLRFNESTATLSIVVSSPQMAQLLSREVTLLNVRALLTVIVKTLDRMDKVFMLVDSVRARYPDVRIIVADDGEGAQPHVSPAASANGIHRRDFLYVPLPYDVGLSAGRNRMLELVPTPYFLTLDDDFLLDGNSRLEHLLWPVHAGELDLAAGKNPRDEAAYGFDFAGLISIYDDTLALIKGTRGRVARCDVVDIVPNLFVASTARIRSLRWDDALKLGEHEDFFLRARTSGLRVGSCPLTSFVHGQEPSWQSGVSNKYNSMRRRIYDYWRISLLKHNLRRLRSFGTLMMIAEPPPPVESLSESEVTAHSARITWIGMGEATKYAVAWAEQGVALPPVNRDVYIEGETMLLAPLLPNTNYTVRVVSGHFLFESQGAVLQFTTKKADEADAVGLLENHSFEKGMLPWIGGFGTTFHTVGTQALSGVLSGRLQIHAAAQLSNSPAIMQISQSVRIGKPLGGVVLVAFSMLEQLFGLVEDVTYEARMLVHFDDGQAPFGARASFSPYTNDWQAVSIHVGLALDHVVDRIDVTLLLGGYRGSALFDDIVLIPMDEQREHKRAPPTPPARKRSPFDSGVIDEMSGGKGQAPSPFS